jgi:hypothetical protein
MNDTTELPATISVAVFDDSSADDGCSSGG